VELFLHRPLTILFTNTEKVVFFMRSNQKFMTCGADVVQMWCKCGANVSYWLKADLLPPADPRLYTIFHLHIICSLRTCGAVPPPPSNNSLHEHRESCVFYAIKSEINGMWCKCGANVSYWLKVDLLPPSCSASIHNAAISNPFILDFLLNIHQLARYFV